ncbi:hypothetical protein B0W20_13675 [Bacillus spizizenii]|jgi:hypothetical protein|nr:hypothetical protein B0W20_13675 [Bacillus spizizenii]
MSPPYLVHHSCFTFYEHGQLNITDKMSLNIQLKLGVDLLIISVIYYYSSLINSRRQLKASLNTLKKVVDLKEAECYSNKAASLSGSNDL